MPDWVSLSDLSLMELSIPTVPEKCKPVQASFKNHDSNHQIGESFICRGQQSEECSQAFRDDRGPVCFSIEVEACLMVALKENLVTASAFTKTYESANESTHRGDSFEFFTCSIAQPTMGIFDWNSDGKSFAIPLCPESCCCPGYIQFVNLNGSVTGADLPSQPSCLSFHRSNQSLLAVGLSSGEVGILNTETSTLHLAAEKNHEDPVTALRWVRSRSFLAWDFLTISREGKCILWTTDDASCTPFCSTSLLGPGKRFLIPFAMDVFGDFLVFGTDNGQIVRSQRVSMDKKGHSIMRLLEMEGFSGGTSICLSSNCSETILAASSGSDIKIFPAGQQKPSYHLAATTRITHLCWSQTRSHFLAVATCKAILLFDLQFDILNPVHVIPVGAEHTEFNCEGDLAVLTPQRRIIAYKLSQKWRKTSPNLIGC